MAELVMEQMLVGFLQVYGDKPWSPGAEIDCCLIIAEWAIWLGRPDPAFHLRGTYTPGEGQIDALRRGGGVLGIFRECAAIVGAKPVTELKCGVVGVIGSPTNVIRQFGVIHDGRGWLTRTEAGFERVHGRTLAVWEI